MGAVVSTMIERLLLVQDRDRKLRRLAKESEDVPSRRKHIEAGIRKEKEAVAHSLERLKQQQSSAKQLELEVESRKEKITRLRSQQFEVKSNEAYRTLEKEIHLLEEEIRKVEDQEITVLEDMETTRRFVAEKEGELKRGESQVKSEMAALDERLTRIAVELRDLQVDRHALAADIHSDWLARYERLMSHTGDYALVPIEHDGCGGCHMKLPPQVAHDARKALGMVSCPYCGRLLYWQP